MKAERQEKNRVSWGDDRGSPTLDEAITSDEAEVTEVSESGSVPQLKVINQSPDPLLILDGEELIGAKQNRVANATLLLRARSETIVASDDRAGKLLI